MFVFGVDIPLVELVLGILVIVVIILIEVIVILILSMRHLHKARVLPKPTIFPERKK